MTYLLIGIVMFFGIHLLAATPVRAILVGSIGENPYKGVFTLISFIGLGLIVWGFTVARAEPDALGYVYEPFRQARTFTSALVLVGLIIIASSHGKGHIRKTLKQPMSLGIALWATGHLLANGHHHEVLLFGSFLAYALFDIIVSTIKGKRPSYAPEIKANVIAIVAGAVLFAILLFAHGFLFGASII